MNRQLAYAVVADGGTDRLLVPIIQWAVHRLDPGVDILQHEFRKRKGSVTDFLAAYRTGAMLIFVHRDSESLTLDERLKEFHTLDRQDIVPVVPVRMSESWLLFDGAAIAKAASAPSAPVPVPGIAQIESILDPRRRLDQLRLQAAGAPSGRRLRTFQRSIVNRRVSVAEFIADYSPLENVSAFRRFQEALAERYPYKSLIT